MKERILKRFNDEIAALERELKVDLPKEIQRAREYGDLRENAEYKAAKERQEIVNARIAMLKKRVGEISMINLDRIPHDRAGFGSTVHLLADRTRHSQQGGRRQDQGDHPARHPLVRAPQGHHHSRRVAQVEREPG